MAPALLFYFKAISTLMPFSVVVAAAAAAGGGCIHLYAQLHIVHVK